MVDMLRPITRTAKPGCTVKKIKIYGPNLQKATPTPGGLSKNPMNHKAASVKNPVAVTAAIMVIILTTM